MVWDLTTSHANGRKGMPRKNPSTKDGLRKPIKMAMTKLMTLPSKGEKRTETQAPPGPKSRTRKGEKI